jgi:hypothetical protein
MEFESHDRRSGPHGDTGGRRTRRTRMDTVAESLEPWCAAGATGVLRIAGVPGGAVYVQRGRIAYVECPLVCGLNRMLAASGRTGAEALRIAAAVRDRHAATGITSTEIVGADPLTPVELKAMLLATLHSAAYFVFDTVAETRFEIGVRHPMAGVVALDLSGVRAELVRRRSVLRAIWPYDHVDRAPLMPTCRIAGHHAGLTTSHWEIAVRANRRHTPMDLAKLLGRDTYATMVAVRRMVASRLIETTKAPAVDAPAAQIPKQRRVRPAVHAEVAPRACPATVLPRRVPRAVPGVDSVDDHSDWSDQELLRIRDALRALR